MISSLLSLSEKSVLLNELMNELHDDEENISNDVNTSVCMITHEVVDLQNCVELPCMHCYKPTAFKKFVLKKGKCIYCQSEFNSDLLKRQCGYLKSNGMPCTVTSFAKEPTCNLHWKKKKTPIKHNCHGIIKSGPNKGFECKSIGKYEYDGLHYCKRHCDSSFSSS